MTATRLFYFRVGIPQTRAQGITDQALMPFTVALEIIGSGPAQHFVQRRRAKRPTDPGAVVIGVEIEMDAKETFASTQTCRVYWHGKNILVFLNLELNAQRKAARGGAEMGNEGAGLIFPCLRRHIPKAAIARG
jgi:hypothetical protein